VGVFEFGLEDFDRVVAGIVVDEDDFEGEGGSIFDSFVQRVDELGEMFFSVEVGNDDGNGSVESFLFGHFSFEGD